MYRPLPNDDCPDNFKKPIFDYYGINCEDPDALLFEKIKKDTRRRDALTSFIQDHNFIRPHSY